MIRKTYQTKAEVSFPGITLYLDVQIDYTVDISSRNRPPQVDQLTAMRVKINGQYQGVEELTVALKDSGTVQEWIEEIQQQETDDFEYGEKPERLPGSHYLG
jgi:hypothetical protein